MPEDLSALEIEIQRGKANLRAFRRKWVSATVVLAVLMILFFYGLTRLPANQKQGEQLAGLFLLSLCAAIGSVYHWLSREIGDRAELELIEARHRILSRLAGGPAVPDESSYFDTLVRINVENLAEYYALVKTHTRNSFTASLSAAGVGFALIVVGLAVSFTQVTNALAVGTISAAAGVLTEFIASVFFYLYNRTVIQLKGRHDSLLDVQNVLLSFKIVGETKEESEKVKMVGQMLTYLLSKKVRLREQKAEASVVGK